MISEENNEYSLAYEPAFAAFVDLIDWAKTDKNLYGAVVCRVVLESIRDIDSAILLIEPMSRIKEYSELWHLCMHAIQTRCYLHHLCCEIQ